MNTTRKKTSSKSKIVAQWAREMQEALKMDAEVLAMTLIGVKYEKMMQKKGERN